MTCAKCAGVAPKATPNQEIKFFFTDFYQKHCMKKEECTMLHFAFTANMIQIFKKCNFFI